MHDGFVDASGHQALVSQLFVASRLLNLRLPQQLAIETTVAGVKIARRGRARLAVDI